MVHSVFFWILLFADTNPEERGRNKDGNRERWEDEWP